jgi:hypothetical protein
MTTDRQLDEILEEIRRDHRKIGAPDSLQYLLSAAAARKKLAGGAPRLRFTWARAVALIILAAVAGLAWRTQHRHLPQTQQARSAPTPRVDAMVPPAEVAESRPVRRMAASRATHRASSTQQATWTVDEFVPLPASEGLPPAAELSVVRMKVRGSDLQQYGLEAPADAIARTMMAEFVVGEDGLPRAIRIVR